MVHGCLPLTCTSIQIVAASTIWKGPLLTLFAVLSAISFVTLTNSWNLTPLKQTNTYSTELGRVLLHIHRDEASQSGQGGHGPLHAFHSNTYRTLALEDVFPKEVNVTKSGPLAFN